MTDEGTSVIGRLARVTARISNLRMGEVRVGIRGGSEDFLAIPADQADIFEKNATVVIVDLLLPRTVVVKKIDFQPG